MFRPQWRTTGAVAGAMLFGGAPAAAATGENAFGHGRPMWIDDPFLHHRGPHQFDRLHLVDGDPAFPAEVSAHCAATPGSADRRVAFPRTSRPADDSRGRPAPRSRGRARPPGRSHPVEVPTGGDQVRRLAAVARITRQHETTAFVALSCPGTLKITAIADPNRCHDLLAEALQRELQAGDRPVQAVSPSEH